MMQRFLETVQLLLIRAITSCLCHSTECSTSLLWTCKELRRGSTFSAIGACFLFNEHWKQGLLHKTLRKNNIAHCHRR